MNNRNLKKSVIEAIKNDGALLQSLGAYWGSSPIAVYHSALKNADRLYNIFSLIIIADHLNTPINKLFEHELELDARLFTTAGTVEAGA